MEHLVALIKPGRKSTVEKPRKRPTNKDVQRFALACGLDVVADTRDMWMVYEALKKPIPPGWEMKWDPGELLSVNVLVFVIV
jgi:hypothetical protein